MKTTQSKSNVSKGARQASAAEIQVLEPTPVETKAKAAPKRKPSAAAQAKPAPARAKSQSRAATAVIEVETVEVNVISVSIEESAQASKPPVHGKTSKAAQSAQPAAARAEPKASHAPTPPEPQEKAAQAQGVAAPAASKEGAKAAEQAPSSGVISSPPPAAESATKAVPPAPAKVSKPIKPTDAKQAKPGGAAHRTGFKANEFIVYPAHGVGQIVQIEEQEVAGFKLELFVISFVKDKMTLKVPLPKVMSGAIRKLADPDTVKKAMTTLTGRARIKRTMWSRRAQEYEAKINSGDLVSIAEVVRDLYRSDAQPEQSYSERQLYEAALDRMAREISAVQRLTDSESLKLIEAQLQKGPRRSAKGEAAAPAEGDLSDADIEEAA